MRHHVAIAPWSWDSGPSPTFRWWTRLPSSPPFLQGTPDSTGSRVINFLLRQEWLGSAVDLRVDAIGAGGGCSGDVLPLDQPFHRPFELVVEAALHAAVDGAFQVVTGECLEGGAVPADAVVDLLPADLNLGNSTLH